MFITKGGAKSWHGRAVKSTNHCEVSADLPECDSHPSIITEIRLRPDIEIHSFSTLQLIMVELTAPYESRMVQAHSYKGEKYLNPDQRAKRCRLQSRCNCWGRCQMLHRIISLRSLNQIFNMWQQKNKSS